jgi:hypothetical protein
MVKRYSIMARQYAQVGEVELCQVDSHPEAIVAAAQQRTLKLSGKGKRKIRVPKYEHVYVVDHEARSPEREP